MQGKVVAVCVGNERGTLKKPIPEGRLIAGYGLDGDCHAGSGARQISLIAIESVVRLAKAGDSSSLAGFSENLTTQGIDLQALKVADLLRVGGAVLEVTQVGRPCNGRCRAEDQSGKVPLQAGLFAKVVVSGIVRPGDDISCCDGVD